MREAYHKELESISEGLVEMANLVGSAMGRATSALLDTDLQLAESVISAEDQVEDMQREVPDQSPAPGTESYVQQFGRGGEGRAVERELGGGARDQGVPLLFKFSGPTC
ncbi:hypothetical protein C4B68_01130 [Streptomyces dengpaensis]|uniref:PhoU domain-containing protein n=1 Tax=Streptomyces dengpaensis TaxID=2049881 RepID=A0ABM6SJ28_9ACTN|nr:hypothetical protein C4B68_01130 [Streptomyces dengpaensis]